MRVEYRDLGVVEYGQCWDYQTRIFSSLVGRKTPSGGLATAENKEFNGKSAGNDNNPAEAGPVLILCEHPHVYTLGRSGKQENLLMDEEFLHGIGAEFVRIDRGGDITYHGPGQLVGYPILDIEALGLGLKEYIHLLEEAIIRTVGRYGITAGRSAGATGVWLEPEGQKGLRKIAAIGVRSSRFVVMHGFALNVSTDMRYFGYINPCGFTDRGVTSLSGELGREVATDEVKEVFKEEFVGLFGVELAGAAD
ncbi:MAG: lipoyl(octanoyl) transferase LipB [Rikenellaceae bacterium]|nr:lipoyl(octanoyl) transferase LipB [Rikenellaceae bacterium]